MRLLACALAALMTLAACSPSPNSSPGDSNGGHFNKPTGQKP